MKNKPVRVTAHKHDRFAGSMLPATIGGPISPRTVFAQMTAGEVQSGRYSRSVHNKLLKLAEELGLGRADAEEIISRCCQDYAQPCPAKPLGSTLCDSPSDLAFRRILTRAFAILVLAALLECLVAYWRS